MNALLEADEEIDSSLYAAYLRAQNNIDLLDILQHLDSERYPARVDAVRREVQRRRILPISVYGLEEKFIRGVCVVTFLLTGILLLLTLLLTPLDSSGPRWPSWTYLSSGTPVSDLMQQVFLGVLRALIVGSADFAFWPLALLLLTGWLLYRAPNRKMRADVKWLAAGAVVVLTIVLFLAAAPFSSVPDLRSLASSAGGFWPRLLSLLWPW